MFKNSLGEDIDQEVPIFPLITYNPEKKIWKCVGTGFFIQPLGGFVTAKHNFYDNSAKHLPTHYAVQTIIAGDRHIRTLQHIIPHPYADIAIGFLGKRRLNEGRNVTPEIAVPFTLNFESLNVGDNIRTYAFPLTETEVLEDGSFQFTFSGKWSSGTVVDCHEEGSSLVRNKCYQTTMTIEHGASGGPVLKNDLVVGVNSSEMKVAEGEIPVSFITPIEFILDLAVPQDDKMIPIRELIDGGHIKVK